MKQRYVLIGFFLFAILLGIGLGDWLIAGVAFLLSAATWTAGVVVWRRIRRM